MPENNRNPLAIGELTTFDLESVVDGTLNDDDVVEIAQIDGVERKARLSQLKPVVAPLEPWQMGVPADFDFVNTRFENLSGVGGDFFLRDFEKKSVAIDIYNTSSNQTLDIWLNLRAEDLNSFIYLNFAVHSFWSGHSNARVYVKLRNDVTGEWTMLIDETESDTINSFKGWFKIGVYPPTAVAFADQPFLLKT